VQAPSALAVVRQANEHSLALRDGATLFYRAWLPPQPTTRALLLFHRGHEHSGRWHETVQALGLEDVAVFAWDQRGHGRSSGNRGAAPDLATVIHDADVWVRHLMETHGIVLEDAIVMAHSLGAVIATAWVHDYGPPVRGLILATPAFRVKLYVPCAVPFLRLRQRVLGPRSRTGVPSRDSEVRGRSWSGVRSRIGHLLATSLVSGMPWSGFRSVANGFAFRLQGSIPSNGSGFLGKIARERTIPARRADAMPMHDWTRVKAGTYHNFRYRWVA
jgi:pimeloyl-ACP methyl ester carboxylesterase